MQTRPFKKIMVAISALDRSAQKLLSKAVAIAERFDAQLQVLHVASNVVEPNNFADLPANPQQAVAAIREKQLRLEKLVKPHSAPGLKIECLVVMDYPAADGIVRQIFKSKPDLLVVQSQRQSRLARVLLSNTDWQLIRDCPCPLWIVKTATLAASPAVLAAIDPFHLHAKPAALDTAILTAAGRVIGNGTGRFGVCHAHAKPQTVIAVMDEMVLLPVTAVDARRYKAYLTETVRRACKPYVIATKDQLVLEGEPATSIPAAIKKWKADLLVMGALSRRGLKRLFIGNTAERVLDATPCDVLIVKPKSFKSSVPRNSPGLKV